MNIILLSVNTQTTLTSDCRQIDDRPNATNVENITVSAENLSNSSTTFDDDSDLQRNCHTLQEILVTVRDYTIAYAYIGCWPQSHL